MKTIFRIFAIVFAFSPLAPMGFSTGCASPASGLLAAETGPNLEEAFWPTNGVRVRAVVAGLTAVDPAAWKGWNGNCPGCDVDSETFRDMCVESGAQAALFQNSAATRSNLLQAARAAWADMEPGDLFIFYVSGHGGQEDDADGDEDDGQDETICLWDGPLTDDALRKLWDEVPDGVRVFMVTDTCHSGTNFKYKPRSLRRSIPRGFDGGLIHYGGCADGESSYGSESGGAFTTALVDAWQPTNTYRTWFEAAKRTMPKNQIPTYAEWGHVTDEFRNATPLK